MAFADGAQVLRTYRYNRRGQRTAVADTVRRTSDGSLLWADSTHYGWNAATGRLDTLLATRQATGNDSLIAAVRWIYDAAGRDTLRTVKLSATGNALTTRVVYDAVGRVSQRTTSSPAGTWYSFGTSSYSKMGDLRSFQASEPAVAGDPTHNVLNTHSLFYDSAAGTRRLLESQREADSYLQYDYDWHYDVFGNRLLEHCAVGQCASHDTVTFGTDNQLLWHSNTGGAPRLSGAWFHDRMGHRLARTDSSGGQYQGPGELLSYTARGQLFFAMTPTAQLGTYDYVWHWYDGAGLRVVSATKQGPRWVPSGPTAQDSTNRTYYVYDGSDVALVLLRSWASGEWTVYQRLVSGGVDAPLAGWFLRNDRTSGQTLALVSDYQGSARAAVQANDTREDAALVNFGRNPFGATEGASGTGGGGTETNTQTGFTGASTPTATGGFTYLRNRWYDGATGRFLTQDPIGLAGGVNLYAYAGNNPVAHADPYGLCPECLLVGLGAAVWGGGQVVRNVIAHRPWHENVAVEMAKGAAIAGTLGIAAPALGTATARTVAASTADVGEMLAPTLAAPERGQKLAQMIARWGGEGGRDAFMGYAQDLANQATQAGTRATGTVGVLANATIYRLGNNYLVTDAQSMIRSYVQDAEAGRGIVGVYQRLGGQ